MVDTTPFEIPKPKERPQDYYSVHYGIYCLKYEVVVSLGRNPRIVHVNGPFPGALHDKTIAMDKDGIGPLLRRSRELAFADGAYIGEPSLFVVPYRKNQIHSDTQRGYNRYLQFNRASVEWINGDLKEFAILKDRFRGDIANHRSYFAVVSNLVNLQKNFQ